MTEKSPAKTSRAAAPREMGRLFLPLQREIDRVFDDFGRGWGALADLGLSPRLDFCETKDGLEWTVELPGMAREDVSIAVDDDMLTISGEKKSEREDKSRNYKVVERSYGAFSRSVYLPRGVDVSKISATMADGVLKIVAPRPEGPKAKTIAITAGK